MILNMLGSKCVQVPLVCVLSALISDFRNILKDVPMVFDLLQTPGDSEGQGRMVCCSPGDGRVGHDLVTELQQRGK